MFQAPHRRYNPLLGEWVLVSPQRAQRPWLGQVEKAQPENLPAHDPGCYLCPRNERVGGVRNPDYTSTFAFDNDFPALTGETSGEPGRPKNELMQAEPEHGICRVVCFSPRHDLTLPELDIEQIEQVVKTWSAQTDELSQRAGIRHVQVFENKGAMMGCSNPHPHSQVWAQTHLPNEPAQELREQARYRQLHHRPMLLDYVEEELRSGERVLATNRHFTAVVPFWAVWPFEVLLVAHRADAQRLPDLRADEVSALAQLLQEVTIRYDNLFEVSFPYSMGFHQAPCDGSEHPEWILHAHFFPPLLRSSTVRKFMVGFELLAMPQRDITPESAASRLREAAAVHYRH